jgi:ATP-dependent Clp protease ATP-binding subunit ClpA
VGCFGPLFERVTPEAQAVLTAAGDEARQLQHAHVGDGHILLGLLREQDSGAATVLRLWASTAVGFARD